MRRDEQNLQIPFIAGHGHNGPSYRPAVKHDPVCVAAVDGILDGLPGDYLAGFFIMVVAETEFLERTVSESFLIVLYELLAVGILQRFEYD